MKPRLLDLFCGAGGAAMGYHRAGFDVVGVDIVPQPNYPFDFREDDALRFLRDDLLDGKKFMPDRGTPEFWSLDGFDAIHASPPCQAYTALRAQGNANPDHPRLIEPVRELLKATGLPYVIENVPQAPLENPVQLCGSVFGLTVGREDGAWHPKTPSMLGTQGRELRRHRLFETNFPLLVPPCWHQRPTIGFYGDHARGARRDSEGDPQDFPDADRVRLAQIALDMPWAKRWRELSEAIPPAYTELIGHQLLAHIRVAA